MTDERCEMQVPERPHYIRNHRCTRKAVERVGEHDFCRQHAAIAREHPAWVRTKP